tara:strand:- start:174215 stop:175012 length:798 start_codon:yes stop_codon:yes gene_type:complete
MMNNAFWYQGVPTQGQLTSRMDSLGYGPQLAVVPTVIEETKNGRTSMDIYSRLLKTRTILFSGQVNDQICELIVAQMLFLESENPTKDIDLHINSGGGSIVAGMTVYDTMQYIKPDVRTVAYGMVASMGSFLSCAGAEGKRLALPNTEVMIHQPLGGFQGQASDIAIHAENIQKIKSRMTRMLAYHSGQNLDQMVKDCDRDNYMTAYEALNYGKKGLIDGIVFKNGAAALKRGDAFLESYYGAENVDFSLDGLVKTVEKKDDTTK